MKSNSTFIWRKQIFNSTFIWRKWILNEISKTFDTHSSSFFFLLKIETSTLSFKETNFQRNIEDIHSFSFRKSTLKILRTHLNIYGTLQFCVTSRKRKDSKNSFTSGKWEQRTKERLRVNKIIKRLNWSSNLELMLSNSVVSYDWRDSYVSSLGVHHYRPNHVHTA